MQETDNFGGNSSHSDVSVVNRGADIGNALLDNTGSGPSVIMTQQTTTKSKGNSNSKGKGKSGPKKIIPAPPIRSPVPDM